MKVSLATNTFHHVTLNPKMNTVFKKIIIFVVIAELCSLNLLCFAKPLKAIKNSPKLAINESLSEPINIKNNTKPPSDPNLFKQNISSPIMLEARIDQPTDFDYKQILNIAVKNNLDILQANQNAKIQKWKWIENVGGFLPDYSLGVNWTRFNGTILLAGILPVGDVGNTGANAFMRLDYMVFNGGKNLANTLISKKLFNAANNNIDVAMQDILLAVTKSYNSLIREQAKLNVILHAVEESKADLKLNSDLERQGVGTKFDVLQSTSLLSEQEQLLIRQQALFRQASITLSSLLNIDQGAHIRPDKNDLRPRTLYDINKPIEEMIKTAKENRSDYKKLKQEYNSKRHSIGAALGDYLPTANIFGEYAGRGNYFFKSDDERGRQLDSSSTYGFAVNWAPTKGLGVPILARIKQAKEEVAMYQTKLDQLESKIEKEVRTAYLNAQSTESLLDVSNRRVDVAKEALRLAKVRLENGIGINTELLNSQTEYKNALFTKVDAIVEHNNSQAELLHALGIISINTLTIDS